MREEDISKMNFKELREEVQLLRDELAIFKRKYEDAIYNLGSENLGKGFTVAQDKMKAQIEITANALKSTVSKEDFEEKLKEYSTIEQTAEKISTTVTTKYVTDLIGDKYVTSDVLSKYSTIEQTASSISSYVEKQINLEAAVTINDLSNATDKNKIYKVQKCDSEGSVIDETYYYYNFSSEKWEDFSGNSVYTMFEQTSEGFKLRGNTVIDGTATITRNLVLSGNVTWDMSNSPVLTQYSSDGVAWHSSMVSGDKYMQMSFDGGESWSTPTKVVGDKGDRGPQGPQGPQGEPGNPGSDASVTAENVFDALTNNGEEQGLFSAFYPGEEDGENKLFINAEYIKSGIIAADYISTSIAQVSSALNIGDPESNEKKMIKFTGGVTLSGEDTYFYTSCERAYFEDLDNYDDDENQPTFYVNSKLVATQEWVKTKSYIAVFG